MSEEIIEALQNYLKKCEEIGMKREDLKFIEDEIEIWEEIKGNE